LGEGGGGLRASVYVILLAGDGRAALSGAGQSSVRAELQSKRPLGN
jgi:hypothetical protein